MFTIIVPRWTADLMTLKRDFGRVNVICWFGFEGVEGRMGVAGASGALPAPNVSRMSPLRLGIFNTASTISGFIPGKIRRHATCAVSRFFCRLNGAIVVARLIKCQSTLVVEELIVASGGMFGDAKAL